MGAIFVSYRREDTEGHAGRLFDDLEARFGKGSVFIDVSSIALGTDFRDAIDGSVATCSVLLAIIGNRWLELKTDTGVRRIDDPGDFVRLETASALKRKIPVVPVLVQGAKMPTRDALPPELQDLAFRNGMELSHARWDSDVAVLMDALQKYMAPASGAVPAGSAVDPGHRPSAMPAAPSPSPTAVAQPASPVPLPRTSPGSGQAKLLGLGGLLLAGAAGAYWYASRPPVTAPPPSIAGPRVDLRTIQSLVGDMNSADEATRKAATTRLIREFGASRPAIDLAIDQLSVANMNAMRAEARINVMTYLVDSDLAAWGPTQRTEASAAVQRIRQNIAAGRVRAGPQLTELVDRLAAKLGV